MKDELRKARRDNVRTITGYINEVLDEMQCRIIFYKDFLRQESLHDYELTRLHWKLVKTLPIPQVSLQLQHK